MVTQLDDVQYNVVEWVHRQARGYSMGQTLVDPRTGEILSAHVTLGSGRGRQDFVLAEGFLAPYIGMLLILDGTVHMRYRSNSIELE